MGESAAFGGSANAIELFALVAYLPPDLSEFLSELRQELDPQFPGKPHLTLLPPRQLCHPWPEAWTEARDTISRNSPIRVELGEVGTFAESMVVFLSIAHGSRAIEAFHKRINAGLAACGELWPYHPHITLGHGFPADQFEAAGQRARDLWRAYTGRRWFELNRVTWVKTTIIPGVSERGTRSLVASDSVWVDLAECDLAAPVQA